MAPPRKNRNDAQFLRIVAAIARAKGPAFSAGSLRLIAHSGRLRHGRPRESLAQIEHTVQQITLGKGTGAVFILVVSLAAGDLTVDPAGGDLTFGPGDLAFCPGDLAFGSGGLVTGPAGGLAVGAAGWRVGEAEAFWT